jgi:putative pyruvate formate lyase activating enzyme
MQPSYLALYHSGELERRAERLWGRLEGCDICPHQCHVNRLKNEVGFCRSGYLPVVASLCAHHGEEPALSGIRGSGTIFFANCNMGCVYCQNYQISQEWTPKQSGEMDCQTLAEKMLYLQDSLGCHNINLVSPSHFIPQIVRAVSLAVPLGLRLPLVYNSGGYDSIATLAELDGIMDIYLPDLRYAADVHAVRYSRAPGYVHNARRAVKEMFRQVGELVLNEAGIAERGLIVRHLILPNGISGSSESLAWLADELSPEVTVSVMAQYSPQYRACRFPELSRAISAIEYALVVETVDKLGLGNGWVQAMSSAREYLPDFQREGNPFPDH